MRLPGCFLKDVENDPNNHLTIRRLIVPHAPSILLAVVHSQSKRNWSDDDQVQGILRTSQTIREREKEYGDRTILVGDLNMNPFEKGVVGAEGLHGVMTKRIAERQTRTVDGRERPFFYNPMWQFFGDASERPPGTYYFPPGGRPIAFFWNLFDQVLIRPQLMHGLKSVRIIDSIGGISLLDSEQKPDSANYSDHLPLLFQVEL
jgi:hypothetical protein